MRPIKVVLLLALTPLALFSVRSTGADVSQGVSTARLLATNSVTMSTSVSFPCVQTGVSGHCIGVRTFIATPDVTQNPVYYCATSSQIRQCLLPGPGPSAPADANYYKITIGYEQSFQAACGCSTQAEYKVVQTSEDWYDANSAGNVWVNEQCTQEHPTFTCDSQTHNAFWDSGIGASTDWSDQYITDHCSCGDRQSEVFLRTWVYPGGAVHFYAGH